MMGNVGTNKFPFLKGRLKERAVYHTLLLHPKAQLLNAHSISPLSFFLFSRIIVTFTLKIYLIAGSIEKSDLPSSLLLHSTLFWTKQHSGLLLIHSTPSLRHHNQQKVGSFLIIFSTPWPAYQELQNTLLIRFSAFSFLSSEQTSISLSYSWTLPF